MRYRYNIFFILSLSAVFFLTPIFTFGSDAPFSYFDNLFGQIKVIIQQLAIPLIFSAVLIIFLWGAALFILKADNEEARQRGKRIMIWGIILLSIMTAFWAIIEILQLIFGTGTTGKDGLTDFPDLPLPPNL